MFRQTSEPIFGVDLGSVDDAPYSLLDSDYGFDAPDLDAHDHWDPGFLSRLISQPAKLVDRAILEVMEKAFVSGGGPNLVDMPGEFMGRVHDTYASDALLQNPRRYFREPETPGRFHVEKLGGLDDGVRLRLNFESTYRIHGADLASDYYGHTPNEMCDAVIWRHNDPGRPTIIGLHCWCGGRLWMEERVFAARQFYEAGYDVALLSMPFHGRRTPERALFSGQWFPSADLTRTNEAFGQAFADIRVLTGWLRRHGHEGPIGLMGGSLGGYTTALTVSLSDDYDFAIPVIAPSSFADILWWHGRGRRKHREAEAAGLTLDDLREAWSIHSPLSHSLQLPKDRVLIVGGAGDAVVRPAQTLSLWHHWGRPEIRWFPGGHLVHFGRSRYLDDILEWLGELDFGKAGERQR